MKILVNQTQFEKEFETDYCKIIYPPMSVIVHQDKK